MLKTGPLVFSLLPLIIPKPVLTEFLRSSIVEAATTFSKNHLNTISPGFSLIPFVYINRPVLNSGWYCVTGSGLLIPGFWFLFKLFHCAPLCLLSLILPVCQFTVSERAGQNHAEVFTTTPSPITRQYYFCCVYLSFSSAWPVRDYGNTSSLTRWEEGWTGASGCKTSKCLKIV